MRATLYYTFQAFIKSSTFRPEVLNTLFVLTFLQVAVFGHYYQRTTLSPRALSAQQQENVEFFQTYTNAPKAILPLSKNYFNLFHDFEGGKQVGVELFRDLKPDPNFSFSAILQKIASDTEQAIQKLLINERVEKLYCKARSREITMEERTSIKSENESLLNEVSIFEGLGLFSNLLKFNSINSLVPIFIKSEYMSLDLLDLLRSQEQQTLIIPFKVKNYHRSHATVMGDHLEILVDGKHNEKQEKEERKDVKRQEEPFNEWWVQYMDTRPSFLNTLIDIFAPKKSIIGKRTLCDLTLDTAFLKAFTSDEFRPYLNHYEWFDQKSDDIVEKSKKSARRNALFMHFFRIIEWKNTGFDDPYANGLVRGKEDLHLVDPDLYDYVYERPRQRTRIIGKIFADSDFSHEN